MERGYMIFLFIIGIIIFIGTMATGLFKTTDKERECFGAGAIFAFSIILIFGMGICLFSPKTIYKDKYEARICNIAEYHVDTTLVINGTATDTIYTFYYNDKDDE